jgi:hypothetical protein
MDFNFGNLSNQNFTSTSTQHLRPYGIYNVTLTKIEKTELKGSKDPNATYPVVALEFTGCGEDKGVFTTNLFIPTSEQDMERPTFKNDEGHEYQRPSRFENFQFTLMQIVHALNPAGEEKIKANASKIKTIDKFIDLIIKALAGKNNVETNLKLVGRDNNGTVYAAIPRSCGINKSGEIFPVNFIGENLFFSNYELTQQKKYQEAKPTKMNDNLDVDSKDGNEEFDLNDIDL